MNNIEKIIKDYIDQEVTHQITEHFIANDVCINVDEDLMIKPDEPKAEEKPKKRGRPAGTKKQKV